MPLMKCSTRGKEKGRNKAIFNDIVKIYKYILAI